MQGPEHGQSAMACRFSTWTAATYWILTLQTSTAIRFQHWSCQQLSSLGRLLTVSLKLSSVMQYYLRHLPAALACTSSDSSSDADMGEWHAGVVPDMHAYRDRFPENSSQQASTNDSCSNSHAAAQLSSSQLHGRAYSNSAPRSLAQQGHPQLPVFSAAMAYRPSGVPGDAGYHAAIIHAHNLFHSCYGMSPGGGYMPPPVPVWGGYPMMRDMMSQERPMAREARVLR